MSDWRLRWQEDYLMNKALYKVAFPDFLEGEKIQSFWHEHCEFCFEKAMTDKACTFYCTEDLKYWICEECFNDFKEQFSFTEKSAEDLKL